jgi:hypothetical protein
MSETVTEGVEGIEGIEGIEGQHVRAVYPGGHKFPGHFGRTLGL